MMSLRCYWYKPAGGTFDYCYDDCRGLTTGESVSAILRVWFQFSDIFVIRIIRMLANLRNLMM
jgi:hypothetical protein